jgi:hypothetical protein
VMTLERPCDTIGVLNARTRHVDDLSPVHATQNLQPSSSRRYDAKR